MNFIQVEVVPTALEKKLYASFDPATQILSAASKHECDWPYGIDIDGSIVFDMNECREVVNIDLLIPPKMWSRERFEVEKVDARQGALKIDVETIKTKSLSLPLKVYYDKSANSIYVAIGKNCATSSVILSESCSAFIAGGELVGMLLEVSI